MVVVVVAVLAMLVVVALVVAVVVTMVVVAVLAVLVVVVPVIVTMVVVTVLAVLVMVVGRRLGRWAQRQGRPCGHVASDVDPQRHTDLQRPASSALAHTLSGPTNALSP